MGLVFASCTLKNHKAVRRSLNVLHGLPIMILVMLTLDLCLARDLTLNDGKTLRDVRLLRYELGTVSIMHQTGGGTYSVSDFDASSRDWIRNYRPPRRGVGKTLIVDESVFELASAIVNQMPGYPSWRTSLAVKLDALSRSETNSVPRIDDAGKRVRNQILWEAFVSEMPRHLLKPTLELLQSAMGREYVKAAKKVAPSWQTMLDAFIRDNETLFDEYAERIRSKARSTSLDKLEIRKIIGEVASQLEPFQRQIMRKHLTPKEMSVLEQLEASVPFAEVARVELRAEYKIAELMRRFDLFASPRENGTPLWLAAWIRMEKGGIQDAYGVTVHYDIDEKGFFPDYWHEPPFSVYAQELGPVMVYATVPLVREFLARYPEPIIRRNLSDVYVMKRLMLGGKWYGGTYGASSVYAAVGQNPQWIMNALHHEFSSILMRNYGFPEDKWRAINDPDWEYSGTGVEMLGREDINVQTEEMLTQGFLVRYSQSSLENDVNVMREWAVVRSEELEAIMARHERIKRKHSLMEQFYRAVFERNRAGPQGLR